MEHIPAELMELLPDGLPRISRYDEFLRALDGDDTPENFALWSQAAYTIMKAPEGAS